MRLSISETAARLLTPVVQRLKAPRDDVAEPPPRGQAPPNFQWVKAASTSTGYVSEYDGYNGVWQDGTELVQLVMIGGTPVADNRYPGWQTGDNPAGQPQFVCLNWYEV